MEHDDTAKLIAAIDGGSAQAADDLLLLLYDELRRLATHKLANEPPQSLDATALVHEAYLRLVSSTRDDWKGRRYFFAAASEAMRRILIDRARAKKAAKRGGDRRREPIDKVEILVPHGKSLDEVLAVHEALDDLQAIDPDAAELVKLRYFAGLTIPEAAQALEISPRSANDLWAYAKAWLFEKLESSR